MLLLLSPSKTIHNQPTLATDLTTLPQFLNRASGLVEILKRMSVEELSRFMGISKSLALLNYTRIREWSEISHSRAGYPAVYAFRGDVYEGLQAETMDATDMTEAQSRLRILSGLYGILRPLDRILPYRLEMGSKLETKEGKDLYTFWGDDPTIHLNELVRETGYGQVVNLASTEYFKVLLPKKIHANLIHPEFRDYRDGAYRIIGIHAKRARGLMASYLIRNRIKDMEGIKGFMAEGYSFNERLSEARIPVFTRDIK